MARLPGRLAAYVALSLLLATGAQASDIACHHVAAPQAARCDGQPATANTCRHADKPPSGVALICDYTMLRGTYERVYAEQLQLLRTGEIGPDEIAAWRRLRDACTSVPCLDRVFANWRDYASQKPVPPAAQALPVPAKAASNARKTKPDAGMQTAVRQPQPVAKPVPREKQQERQQEKPQEKQRDTQPATARPASPAASQPLAEAVLPAEGREQPVAPVVKSRPLPDTVPPPAPQPPPEFVADRKINEHPIAPATTDRPLPDAAPLAAPQPPHRAVTERETPERPVAPVATNQPPPGPATRWTPIYPIEGSLPGRWEPLGALAWLILCGVCVVRWCRRRRVEWLPDAARRRERARTATRIVLVSAGLIAVNSIVLFWILA
ncbi:MULTISPECIES: hypothetical protein [unclassified Cupriavidus]|uniref:hypothetical protein n=1 Tax=unclassified Cupriavidus TaxID=2640874 RepID=UPI000688F696|nr:MULTISPECIES: hypothetical protein [unclassified Cupriavidus]MBP0637274.1 hypothetical protein [Cupriavidus sp. AcVe19-6a]